MRWLRRFLGLDLNTGRAGERLAARWLKARGYRIIERNLKLVDDEADLVALDPDGTTVVIVEVKTRRSGCSTPETAMTGTKQYRLSRLAARLQQTRRYENRPLRFDVLAVDWREGDEPVFRHTPGAFHAPW